MTLKCSGGRKFTKFMTDHILGYIYRNEFVSVMHGNRMEAAPAAAPMMRPAPGTGYGESTWSPSHSVDFEPVGSPMEKLFLKYEWRETLCEKRVLPECRAVQPPRPGNNRFWPENGGYAPPPPRH